jgi:hypothetical protein
MLGALRVGIVTLGPGGEVGATALASLGPSGADRIRHDERLMRPAELGAGAGDFILAEGAPWVAAVPALVGAP